MPRRKKTKKIWTAPLLTVVVRGEPEERVLGACKINYPGGPGPSYNACWMIDVCWGECYTLGIS